jgi:hypothetical protein
MTDSGQPANAQDGNMANIGSLVNDLRMCRRLVVLGSPGASKTTISILILLGMLETREPSEPVPVLLSAATWDRDETDVHGWIVRRLRLDYPDLGDTQVYGASAIREMVSQHRILPVIDGIDELPAPRRALMIRALNREFDARSWLVVTCRTEEYRAAVAESNEITAAAVIELEPVLPEEAIKFLEKSAGVRRASWQPVFDRLEQDQHGPLAAAFASPLMVELARDAYDNARSDPSELTRLPDQAAIEDRLLGSLVPIRFGDDESDPYPAKRWDGKSAYKWLAFLAVHMERSSTLDLAWWQLRRMLPALERPYWRILLFVASSWIVTGVFFGIAAGVSFGLRAGLLTGVHQGLDVGLVIGMAHLLASPTGPKGSVIRTAFNKLPSVIRRIVTPAFDRFPRVAAAVICPVPYTVETGLWYGITSGATTGLKRGILDWIATACIVGLAVRMDVLTAAEEPTPNRFRLRRGRHLAGALVLGTLSGGIIGVIAGYSLMSDPSVMGTGSRWSLDAFAWIVVGLGFALVSWARAPAPTGRAASPSSTLVGDRTLVLWGLPAVILFALVYGMAFALAPSKGLHDSLHFGIYGLGLGFAVWFVVASTQAWPHYLIASCALASRGKIPLRLMSFLREAHRLRILHQDGSVYQFRHARLQKYLAQKSSTTPLSRLGSIARPAGCRMEIAFTVLAAERSARVQSLSVR